LLCKKIKGRFLFKKSPKKEKLYDTSEKKKGKNVFQVCKLCFIEQKNRHFHHFVGGGR
jgi:hypothetical protein